MSPDYDELLSTAWLLADMSATAAMRDRSGPSAVGFALGVAEGLRRAVQLSHGQQVEQRDLSTVIAQS